MPIYEYFCSSHGVFEVLSSVVGCPNAAPCPSCSLQCGKIVSMPSPAIIHEREHLPLGSGSRGRYIGSEETGGLPILIPSFCALEKEEVDYVAETAIAGEKERVKKAEPRLATVALKNVVSETLKVPKGKRKKTLDQITKEGMV